MSRDVTNDPSNPNKTTPVFADKLPIIDTETTPNSLKEITLTNFTAWLANHTQVSLPDGTMINGKVSVTVVSNDLVLALKTLAGSDPSTADPVYIKINGTFRSVTAATSCTLAAATNWANAGSAELATKEIDWFAYAVWDSNSSVVAVAPARIPYGRLVSDFSATTTNEKHIGNYANYTSTDDCVVIGRFAATLSAGAGYTWTVPTFTNANLVQHPNFETRWLTYVPTLTNASTGNGTLTGKYMFRGRNVFAEINLTFGSTSAISGSVSVSVPISQITDLITPLIATAALLDSGTSSYDAIVQVGSATTLALYVPSASGSYVVPAVLSSTVPFTWATNDQFSIGVTYIAA